MPIALLDIEGTVCPITFVKDCLFPYFSKQYPSYLRDVSFPIDKSDGGLADVLAGFPKEAIASIDQLKNHIDDLVARDVKDPVLKSFQGLVWKEGYAKGDLKAPVYEDAIAFINRSKSVYIYSSGSVGAQKLLFSHVDVNGALVDLTPKLKGYFDITTAGFKQEKDSYLKIAADIGCDPADVIFYSDNVLEVKAALEAGMASKVVVRPGNAELSESDKKSYECISSFTAE